MSKADNIRDQVLKCTSGPGRILIDGKEYFAAECSDQEPHIERSPLLTNGDISKLSYQAETIDPDNYGDGWDCNNQERNWQLGAEYSRDFYEGKITSGELIRKDEISKDVRVRAAKDGQGPWRMIELGAMASASKPITQLEFDQLAARGAMIIE